MSDNLVYNACDFCGTFFDFVWLDSPESSLDKNMKGILWFWLEFNWWLFLFILCCFIFWPRFIKLGNKGKTELRFKWFNRIQQVSQIKRVKLKESYVHLTREQYGFKLYGSTYTWIFLSKYYSTTQSTVSWIHMCGKANYKLYEDLWLLRGSVTLTCSLFEGQLYLLKIKWTKANWEETFQRLTYKENGSLCWPQINMSLNYGLIG